MRIRKAAAMAGAAAAAAIGLAACSHAQPSLGEYAIVTNHGSGSNQEIRQVVQPGVSYTSGSGSTSWYVPAGIRNYVTGTGGDRATPQAELTATGPGHEDGMSDLTYTSVYFELNPAIAVNDGNWKFTTSFLKFCLKYACADSQPQNDSGNSSLAHSSDPGWNNMLAELMPHAIDNATLLAIQDFPPALWNTRGDWPKLAADIQQHIPGEIAKMTGTATGGKPYFCGAGSTMTRCAPPTVIVNDVTPSDPGVQQEYQNQQTALYAEQAAAQELAAAKAKYGPNAYWTLSMLAIIDGCKASNAICYIDGNQAPVHP
jgi:hypothetical protein